MTTPASGHPQIFPAQGLERIREISVRIAPRTETEIVSEGDAETATSMPASRFSAKALMKGEVKKWSGEARWEVKGSLVMTMSDVAVAWLTMDHPPQGANVNILP